MVATSGDHVCTAARLQASDGVEKGREVSVCVGREGQRREGGNWEVAKW